MKFNIGDLVRFNEFSLRVRLRPHIYPLLHLRPHIYHPLLRLRPLLRPHPHLHLINTYGIIISTEKHNEIFEKDSTDDDNGYVWLSQIEQKEYYFYENEAAATKENTV